MIAFIYQNTANIVSRLFLEFHHGGVAKTGSPLAIASNMEFGNAFLISVASPFRSDAEKCAKNKKLAQFLLRNEAHVKSTGDAI